MKKIYSIITVLFITASVFGQAPKCFKYQAVLRDARGNIRANTSTSIIISILSGSATGNTVYSETHSVKTDGYGLVNLEIGNGTATIGTMSAIDWSNGTYFIKTTVDGVVMGTNQLLSVPFAQYANRAANGISRADSAKLAGIAPGAEVNVNADWNAVSGDAQILNKPIIPAYDGSETKVTGSSSVTVTGQGTTSTPYVIATGKNSALHAVGDSLYGGIVFYVYDGGLHGLIAATSDATWYDGESNETYFGWCPSETTRYTGATGDGISSGYMNTMTEVTMLAYQYGSFAAKVCSDYSATVKGVIFGGWYLPSKYELNLLYKQRAVVGSLNEDYYWSSTEYFSTQDEVYYEKAWFQSFYEGDEGYQDVDYKYDGYLVRPIRAF